MLFEKLGDYFDARFGAGWKEHHAAFWKQFARTHQIGRGIQERLKRDDRVRDKIF